MAKKRSKKRRPPPRRPAAASGAAEAQESGQPASRRAERKEEARKERERRIRQAKRRQRNRRLIRWGIAGAAALGITAFVVVQMQQGREQAARAAQAAERVGCGDLEVDPNHDDPASQSHQPPFAEGTGGVPVTHGPHSNALGPEPKVYDQPILEANSTHNLEHGYVLVFYSNEGELALDDDVRSELEDLVQSEEEVLMAPYEGLASSLALVSWGGLQTCDIPADADAGDVVTVAESYIEENKNSGRAPEAAAI